MEYRYKPTTHGRNVMAACMSLERPFHITRVAFGSGLVDGDTNLADVHELLEYISDGAVAERRHEDDRFYLTVQFANAAHPEVKTFLLTEFIVYVEDPETGKDTDLLYGTLGDYRQPVPAYNPAFPPSVFNFPLTLIISDEINVAVSAPAGLVTVDTAKAMLSEHDQSEDAHADLLKQFIKVGESGKPGSAVLLGADGKVPAPFLPDEIFKQDGVSTAVITIPASAWQTDADGPRTYRAEVACENATDAHIPYVSLDSASAGSAESCGFCDKAEASDGVLRFWADTAPAGDIVARAALFGPGGESNTLPVATAGRAGIVKPGPGLSVSPDGTLSVNTASEAEINQMLAEVLAPDNK